MPISSPRPSRRNSTTGARSRHPRLVSTALGIVFAATALSASAQMLAHPNWAGNGMSTDPWWQHAIIYRVDGNPSSGANSLPGAAAPVDYKYLISRINAVRALGIDALLLPAPPMPSASAPAAQPGSAANDIDLLDQLIRTASTRGVRVLLAIQPSPDQDLNGVARFWLNHGIAGFYLLNPPGATPQENDATAQLLDRITASVVGQRIVLSDLGASSAQSAPAPTLVSASRHGSHAPHSAESSPGLEVDTRFAQLQIVSAATLRSLLSATGARSNLLLELPAPQAGAHSLADILAAAALTTHPAALISSDVHLELPQTPDSAPEPVDSDPAPQPPAPPPGVYLPYKPYVPPAKKKSAAETAIPTDPLTAWYKQLATLHHSNAAVRAGQPEFLDFDQQNAVVWVERAAVSNLTPAVVVACNLSGSPVTLSMRAPLESLGLHGNYLRTLLRSDHAMGPQDLGTVVVPAYGVYVGELRR